MITVRSGSPHAPELIHRPFLPPAQTAQNQAGVAAAEAERVRHRDADRGAAGPRWRRRQRSTSGSSRLIVGGIAWCRMAARQASASKAPAAVSRWPVMLLVELTGIAAGGVAQDGPEHGRLGGVADGRAGGVGVDVIDLVGLDPRVGQGPAHGGDGRARGRGWG